MFKIHPMYRPELLRILDNEGMEYNWEEQGKDIVVFCDHPRFEEIAQRAKKRTDATIIVYDGYKELNGIRPRWLDFEAMTDTELFQMADAIVEEIHQELTRRKKARDDKRKLINTAKHNPRGILWKDGARGTQAYIQPEPPKNTAMESQLSQLFNKKAPN